MATLAGVVIGVPVLRLGDYLAIVTRPSGDHPQRHQLPVHRADGNRLVFAFNTPIAQDPARPGHSFPNPGQRPPGLPSPEAASFAMA